LSSPFYYMNILISLYMKQSKKKRLLMKYTGNFLFIIKVFCKVIFVIIFLISFEIVSISLYDKVNRRINKSNRCLKGRIGNEVKVFSGPTTVKGSFIWNTTGVNLGRLIKRSP